MRSIQYAALALALVPALGGCAGGPDALAERFEQALARGDADAILALAHVERAPALARYMLMKLPDDCRGGTVCAVSVVEADAEWKRRSDADLARTGTELPVAAEGLLEVAGRPAAGAAAGSGRTLRVRLPYARIGGQYRIVLARYTTARLAELEATTAQAAAEATLALGVEDPVSGERDLDWRAKAAPLPSDGGEPGAALATHVQALAAALRAGDVDAAMTLKGAWGKVALAAVDRNGDPIPLADRQRKLRAHALRFLTEVRVLGGYQLGDTALLVVEGRNGAGNAVRGAWLMQRRDGNWIEQGDDVIEIPTTI
jgi:hypothetical protein